MPPVESVEAPRDLSTTNLWRMEIDGVPVATLTNVSGPTRSVGSLSKTDGGTGVTYKFSDQKPDFGNITLVHRRDPQDPNNNFLRDLVTEHMANGKKVDATFIKFHHGEIEQEIISQGIGLNNEALPSFDKESSSAYDVTYSGECDYWNEED